VCVCVCVCVCGHLYYATPYVSEHLLNVQDVGDYVYWKRLLTSLTECNSGTIQKLPIWC